MRPEIEHAVAHLRRGRIHYAAAGQGAGSFSSTAGRASGFGDKRSTPGAQREAWYQHFHLLPLAERLLDGDRRSIRLYLAHFYAHWAGHTPN